MWRILIAEIFYNRYIITFILFISAIHLILLHFWPEITGEMPSNSNIGYNQLNYMLINFLAIVLIYLSKFENRGRLHVLLPVRPKSLGLNRLILFTLYWIGLLLLFFLSTEISIYYLLDTKTLLALCTQTGIALFLFGFIFMVNDKRLSMNMITMTRFKISNKRLYAILIIVSVIFLGFVALAGMIHTYQNSYPLGNINRNFYTWMYQSESGVLFFMMLGLVFSLLSIYLFPKRKSFLD